MANFEASTASSKLIIRKNKRKKFLEWLDQFYWGELNISLEENGFLHIYGDDWFQLFKVVPDEGSGEVDFDSDITDVFLEGIKQFIPNGETLTIQCIGSEKCRFPFSAWQVKITKEKVKHTSFESD